MFVYFGSIISLSYVFVWHTCGILYILILFVLVYF